MKDYQFKVGDRIAYHDRNKDEWLIGTVVSMSVRSKYKGMFPIDVDFDNGYRTSIEYGPWIMLEVFHNSPLMKALE